MSYPDFSLTQWLVLALGATGIGVSKSGLPGVSLLHVILYASIFGARESAGVLLPMLIVGDVCAIKLFGRRANWSQVRRLLPPTLMGLVLGWLMMGRLSDLLFQRLMGVIILTLAVVQSWRLWQPHALADMPHRRSFAYVLGGLAGLTTMLANAAGPIVALYLLAVKLPKWELIGTGAWLFLVLNVIKVPFNYQLGILTPASLQISCTFAVLVPLGIYLGKWLVAVISQQVFNTLLLAFTAIAALRMIGCI